MVNGGSTRIRGNLTVEGTVSFTGDVTQSGPIYDTTVVGTLNVTSGTRLRETTITGGLMVAGTTPAVINPSIGVKKSICTITATTMLEQI